MNKALNILKQHKYAIIWTLCYVAAMWLILKLLFNFDMLSTRHWQYLSHAQLHGFPGFVFGILVLAALPLYVASTTLIIRTKKPLITIPTPKAVKKVWTQMQPTLVNPPAPINEVEENTTTTQTTEEPIALPDNLPSELRPQYIRTRLKLTPEQHSAFNQPILSTTIPTTKIMDAPTTNQINNDTFDEIPLPSDFDIDITPETDFASDTFTPTFTDINFDAPSTDSISTNSNPICEYLESVGKKYDTEQDIITTNTYAIATHSDPDFWVCDEDFWFATGKQIPSPIKNLIRVAEEHNLKPILYMASENIMNPEKMFSAWESLGITIIRSPSEIPE